MYDIKTQIHYDNMGNDKYIINYNHPFPGGHFRSLEVYIGDEETLLLYLGAMIEIIEDTGISLTKPQKLKILRDFANMLSHYPIEINEHNE